MYYVHHVHTALIANSFASSTSATAENPYGGLRAEKYNAAACGSQPLFAHLPKGFRSFVFSFILSYPYIVGPNPQAAKLRLRK